MIRSTVMARTKRSDRGLSIRGLPGLLDTVEKVPSKFWWHPLVAPLRFLTSRTAGHVVTRCYAESLEFAARATICSKLKRVTYME